jgi:hypothetical protein
MQRTLHELWQSYPPVGIYIAILGLFGVLVPLLRDISKIGRREKAAWTALMFILLGLEIKSLYQDRNAHDFQQAEARKEQLREFSVIADGINTSISLEQSVQQGNQALAHLVQPLTKKDAFKKKALTLSTYVLQDLLAGQVPRSSGNAVYLMDRRKKAIDQLFRMGFPAKLNEVCDEFKQYGLSCTEPESADPLARLQAQAQEIADLALKL